MRVKPEGTCSKIQKARNILVLKSKIISQVPTLSYFITTYVINDFPNY